MTQQSLAKTACLTAITATLFFNVSLANAAEKKKDKPLKTFTTESKTVQVFTTAQASDKRITATDSLQLSAAQQPIETEISVIVNTNKRFQRFLGIGGAITDSSAEVFAKLSADKQAEFLKAYYDKDQGIGYSLARTTIHSSDFSSSSYTYVNEGDKALSSFSIDHDRQFRVPLIKKAIAAAGGKLTLFASPWSAPAFMKSNNHMLQGGTLLPEYANAWAMYFTKFIKAYEAEGIPIWGITVQNEPLAKQRWESMLFTAEEERDFLKNHLGPVMHKEGLGSKKIIVWDHNRDLMTHRASVIFDDPQASKYAWGLGFHWYETWTGGEPMFKNVAEVARAYPDKHLMLTEATVEKFNPERYQYWPNAERYGIAMINDLNAGSVAWTDWNILLDEKGGPNHVNNFCFSPIHADTKTGELIYTPSYYYIGHLSKFIRPNAQRVSAVSSRSALLTTSFLNDDNKLVTVVMNQSDKNISYKFLVNNAQSTVTIPAHGIQTLVL
jgi:glucosylceramidase